MKKHLLLFVFLSTLFVTVNAQIGVMAGGNFATYNEPSDDYSYLPGVNAFVIFEKDVIPMTDLRVGFGYIQKGTAGTVLGVDYISKLNYLQLNLHANIKPPLLPLYAFVGPYVSYGLSGYTKVGSISADITFDSDHTNPFDMGLNMGVGFQKKIIVSKIFLEVGYSMGMMNIDKSGLTDYTKNSGIYIDLGFTLGK